MSRVRSVVSSLNASAQRIVSTRSSSIRSLSLYQNKRWASTKAGSNSSTNPFGDDGRCDPHGLYQFELAFLGTGASPSKFRSPSSTLFYFADKSWLFDAGDGTMRQTCFGEYSYATLSKIFISRMGPNNLFGLPTMLVYCCSGKGNKDHEPFHIYGPPGIYTYVCYMLSSAHVTPSRQIIVHELSMESKDMETLDSYSFPWIKEKHSYVYKNFDPIPVPNITLKRVYSMPENGYWKIVEEPEVTVLAGLVGMSQPSFGFVVKEVAKSGIMNTKKIQDAKISVHQLAELKRGIDVTLLDGKVLKASDVISESVPGRKVCIISSGRDSSGLAAAAKNCDVLIHEAAYSNSKSAIASEKGHSNTELAVTAAKNFKAKRLVLSSIGNQYFPAGGNKKFAIGADVLLQEAKNVFDRPNHVTIAHDYMNISIPQGGFDIDPNSTLVPFTRSFKIEPKFNYSNSGPKKKV